MVLIRKADHGFTVTWPLSGCRTSVIRAGAEKKTPPELRNLDFCPKVYQRAIKITNQLLPSVILFLHFLFPLHTQMTKLHFENCAGYWDLCFMNRYSWNYDKVQHTSEALHYSWTQTLTTSLCCHGNEAWELTIDNGRKLPSANHV